MRTGSMLQGENTCGEGRAGCRFPAGLPATDRLGLVFSFLTHWETFERFFFFTPLTSPKPLFSHLYNGNNILTLQGCWEP